MNHEISNILLVDDNLTLSQSDGNVAVLADEITITGATSLKVIYKANPTSNQLTLNINASLELYEFYEYAEVTTLDKTINVAGDVELTRYVENRSQSQVIVDVSETVTVAGATVKTAYLDLGLNSGKSTIKYVLSEPGSDVDLHLGALSDGCKKHYDVSLVHTSGHTHGNMDNYGIVKNKGSLIIDGTGKITKGSAKSNTHQVNKIIVFDKKCQAQANPYLLVDEFDVNASHGASVGKIDDEQLFYLQSRGLSDHEAMSLVTIGYFMPVINYINNESIKEEVANLLNEKVNV